MGYIYLSHYINSHSPTYGNRNKFINEIKSSISDGDTCNENSWSLTTNHIGTHVDFPNHFYDNGFTLSEYKPKDFIFNKVYLIEAFCDKAKLLSENDLNLKNIPINTDFLIIKTNYGKHRGKSIYWDQYPSFSYKLIKKLKNKFKLKAIGFDLISLTSPLYKSDGKKSHKILLSPKYSQQTIIVEDMNLEKVTGDTIIKNVIIAPLLVEKANGSPVTIIADTN